MPREVPSLIAVIPVLLVLVDSGTNVDVDDEEEVNEVDEVNEVNEVNEVEGAVLAPLLDEKTYSELKSVSDLMLKLPYEKFSDKSNGMKFSIIVIT